MSDNALPDDFYAPDLELVPTAADLVRRQLALVELANRAGEPTIVRILPEGYELIHQAMARNAERMRQWAAAKALSTTHRELTKAS